MKLKLHRDSNIICFGTHRPTIQYISHIQDRMQGLRFLHLSRLREIYVQDVETCNLNIDTGLLSALIFLDKDATISSTFTQRRH
jgi:hypothetical protein